MCCCSTHSFLVYVCVAVCVSVCVAVCVCHVKVFELIFQYVSFSKSLMPECVNFLSALLYSAAFNADSSTNKGKRCSYAMLLCGIMQC